MRTMAKIFLQSQRLKFFPLRSALAMLCVFFNVAAFAESPALTPVTDPKPLLDQMQSEMAKVSSFYLEFVQERRLKLFDEPLKTEGAMVMTQSGDMRWETTTPFQSILLGNAKSVAQFEFSKGKWEKLKVGMPQMLKQMLQQMTLMHQGKLETLTNDFALTVSTGAVTVVTMTPKNKDISSFIAALEIHLAPDLTATREVVMREPGGDFTRIIFNREKRNVTLPPGTFDQNKPLDLAAIKAAVQADK